MAMTRNMTQMRLFRLPPEVILLITEDDSLKWEDLRRLRHVCSFFFHHLGRRVLKFGDFFFFRNACSHANVDILIECLDENATPTNTSWKSPHPSAGDYVVNGFRTGNVSVEQFKHTWQWLSDHGFELSYSKDVTGDVPEHHRPFSADLLYMVWDATEAKHLQATCDIIHFVVDKGMMFPRYLSFSFEATGDPICRGLIQFMLAAHCPASILKLFLKQLHGQGLTLKSPVNSQIYERETTETYTFLWEMYRYIFDSLPPWSSGNQDTPRVLLRLEDPNGIADNFGDKVKALIEYNSVDDGEARVWTDVWRSLEKMARKRIEQGSLDFDQDGVWFWYELNMSIAYLATDRTVLEGRARDSQDDPIHVFKIQNEGWHPPERLGFIRMRFAEERGTIDPSKLEDRSIGDWWNMPLCDWDFLVPEHKIDSKGWLEHRAAEDDILRMRGALVE
ncbi:uncharacterized protein FSUBG_12833 [Fusarium subglutinans]|uniref:F-box domain-containing protein n=1 Tax=Gibberella subglutinans TaxID=42677 RepID=A0A8H5L550_GIBSU|nr:uncharacterized protein FSUBG_12833 [Fusarium subglutinans]KAF5584266.1 hypothetical protein FSUBG_12833 [Fusarium subglutinans]